MTNLEAKIESIDRKLSQLLNQQTKKTWVKVSIITELTGWDKEYLRKARDNGLVKFRDYANGREYLLESINPMFLKKQSA